MNSPLVSIGLPLVNERIQDVEFAVRSIYAQSVSSWELFIFCDGSSDAHVRRLSEISDPRIRILRNPSSKGIAHSLNRLAQMARGEYLAILAADDAWVPNRLQIQLDRLTDSDAPDVLAGQMAIISDAHTVEGGQARAVIPSRTSGWVSGTPISHATAMARTRWFQEHPYDESLMRAQDRAFWITAHRGNKIEILDEILYYYRVPTIPNYRKYARSCSYARKVIRTYGHQVCPWRIVLAIYIKSLVKQGIIAIAYAAGRYPDVYRRRLIQMSDHEKQSHLENLSRVFETPVPGWD